MKNCASLILLVSVLFVVFIAALRLCSSNSNSCKNKKSRAKFTEANPGNIKVIPTTSGQAVNTICPSLLHSYRNMSSYQERENFTPAYKQEVAVSGCNWKPFEDVRCENMPADEGVRRGCDPMYYEKRCGLYKDYVRLISGSDVKPFIYPIERLIKGECDSSFNPYV